MTRRELYKYLRRHAEPIYGLREATQIIDMIFDEMLGISRIELLMDRDSETPSPLSEQRAKEIAQQLSEGRPVQYIIGEADFCDLRFLVREGVLIPRPESEELIRWIVSEDRGSEALKILDIGTGSGALAISLSVALPHSQVTALDISDDAINIAKLNIERLAQDVKIIKGDALDGVEKFVVDKFDIIVSNPPYIPRSEESQMRINVTQHEPHLALFVPDNDPLLFYRSIARSAKILLHDEGSLYFEIHENYATECKEMLHAEGYAEVEIRVDINDKARMICAKQ